MIHTPVDNWKKIPEAAAALEKEWVKLEKMPVWDPKQVKEKDMLMQSQIKRAFRPISLI